jgi:hypothetical protein
MGLVTGGPSVVQCWCCNPALRKSLRKIDSRVALYSCMARMATDFAKTSPNALGVLDSGSAAVAVHGEVIAW